MVTPPALQALLAGAIDYAGLFPPAALTMDAAVREYARVRRSREAWALGRFVVPAARLEELAAAGASAWASRDRRPWPVAATLGAELAPDLDCLARFAEQVDADHALVDTVELRVADAGQLAAVLRTIPAALTRYVELPLAEDPAPYINHLVAGHAFAKFRTGGVTRDAFPAPEALLRALEAAVGARLRFKCTAGLHHPVRGRYRLTYAPNSPTAEMYGYLNVFLATAALVQGQGRDLARRILLEADPAAFTVRDKAVAWRDVVFPAETLRALREHGMRAFGSCSFREPVDELAAVAA